MAAYDSQSRPVLEWLEGREIGIVNVDAGNLAPEELFERDYPEA